MTIKPENIELHDQASALAEELLANPTGTADRHFTHDEIDYVRGVVRRIVRPHSYLVSTWYAGNKSQVAAHRRFNRSVHYQFSLRKVSY